MRPVTTPDEEALLVAEAHAVADNPAASQAELQHWLERMGQLRMERFEQNKRDPEAWRPVADALAHLSRNPNLSFAQMDEFGVFGNEGLPLNPALPFVLLEHGGLPPGWQERVVQTMRIWSIAALIKPAADLPYDRAIPGRPFARLEEFTHAWLGWLERSVQGRTLESREETDLFALRQRSKGFLALITRRPEEVDEQARWPQMKDAMTIWRIAVQESTPVAGKIIYRPDAIAVVHDLLVSVAPYSGKWSNWFDVLGYPRPEGVR